MTEKILDIIIRWAIPFLLTSAATALIGYYKGKGKKETEERKKLEEKIDAVADGTLCMLRAEIIRDNKEYTQKGYCPVYAKESLTAVYKAYHRLGGNDVATRLYEEVLELPAANKK